MCEKTYQKISKKGHICDEPFCSKCFTKHSRERECHIEKYDPKQRLPKYRIFVRSLAYFIINIYLYIKAFDFESTQDTITEIKDIFEHCVNFISAKWTCTECLGEIRPECEICSELGEMKPRKSKRGKKRDKEAEATEEIMEQNSCQRSKYWSELEGCENPLRDFVRWFVTAFPNNAPTLAYAHAGGHYVKNYYCITYLDLNYIGSSFRAARALQAMQCV